MHHAKEHTPRKGISIDRKAWWSGGLGDGRTSRPPGTVLVVVPPYIYRRTTHHQHQHRTGGPVETATGPAQRLKTCSPRWPSVGAVASNWPCARRFDTPPHRATCWPTARLPHWQRGMVPSRREVTEEARGNSHQARHSFFRLSELEVPRQK